MASALLWHFEDEDVRTENINLRNQLGTTLQESAKLEAENRGLIQQTAAAVQERESARLEVAAWREYIIKLNGMLTSMVGEDKGPTDEKLDDTASRSRLNGPA
ncbi:hypothetical protein AURDEDRAFT_166038 [Auricularia subglabra TFB-10046 SS5]|nr:hypothetical protein AURDEDRAFT_166038 [Auricularia subglabra TFB-10046 SS5]